MPRRPEVQRAPALLLLLMLAGAAQAGNWPEVPLPEGARGEVVSSDMVHNGLPMQASRFSSSLSPDQLVGFYRRSWGAAKVTVTDLGNKRIIGHHRGNHFITVEVSGGAGGSQAQVGIVELLRSDPRHPPGHGFPAPSGSRVITDTRFLDNPGRTLSLESNLSTAQAWEWYRARLQQQGWTQEGGDRCPIIANQCSASYTRGAEAMSLTFERTPAHTAIVANQLRR
jgi:hypothetical protein